VTFEPPLAQPATRLGLTDVLAHLIAEADAQLAVTAIVRLSQGMDDRGADELNRRLGVVRRLAGELQAELAAVQALQPSDPIDPTVG
jgi:hypothetical protein